MKPKLPNKLLYYPPLALVVLTALTGYAMAPGPISATLLYGCLGTTLCSAAANTFNQVYYIPCSPLYYY